MPDETTTPAQARQALIPYATGGLLEGDNYWTDLLKQTYHTYREQAMDSEVPETKRKNYALAALAADLLSQYYQRNNQREEAEGWGTRATRLYRIAFQRKNSILENIGGVMK